MVNYVYAKPAKCTCSYPHVIARNMCGHAQTCPVYKTWYKKTFKGAEAISLADRALISLRKALGDAEVILAEMARECGPHYEPMREQVTALEAEIARRLNERDY